MVETAENLAKQYEIARSEQDEYALRSHQRSVAAIEAGKFDAEIVGVPGRVRFPRTLPAPIDPG